MLPYIYTKYECESGKFNQNNKFIFTWIIIFLEISGTLIPIVYGNVTNINP